MKLFALIGLLAAAALSSGGCSGMAYSHAERSAMIDRTWNIDGRQIVDDWDSFLMLHPPSYMTLWHIR